MELLVTTCFGPHENDAAYWAFFGEVAVFNWWLTYAVLRIFENGRAPAATITRKLSKKYSLFLGLKMTIFMFLHQTNRRQLDGSKT